LRDLALMAWRGRNRPSPAGPSEPIDYDTMIVSGDHRTGGRAAAPARGAVEAKCTPS
jgi:hypothetical protein